MVIPKRGSFLFNMLVALAKGVFGFQAFEGS